MASGEDSALRRLCQASPQGYRGLCEAQRREAVRPCHARRHPGTGLTLKDLQSSYDHAGNPPGADAWLLKYVTNIIENELVPLAAHGDPTLDRIPGQIPRHAFLPMQYRAATGSGGTLCPAGDWSPKGRQIRCARQPADRRSGPGSQPLAHTDARLGASCASRRTTSPATRSRRAATWARTQSATCPRPLTWMSITRCPIARHWAKTGYNTGRRSRYDHRTTADPGIWSCVDRATTAQRRRGRDSTEPQRSKASFESDMAEARRCRPEIRDRPFLRADSRGGREGV